jgi:hypothetical protein
MKTRRGWYIFGLILIFQSFIFFPLSNNTSYTNFITDRVMGGCLIICIDALYTLFLAFNFKARWIEFFAYLSGILVVVFIGFLMLIHIYSEANTAHLHPRPNDTVTIKSN